MTQRAPEINADWRRRMTEFFAYMRDQGSRWPVLVFGQMASLVGMVVESDGHHNDNGIGK